ncbi:MAG: hypothetical protein JXL97_12490 [Bacteroidales bacterium]|nr:hypothetical protein [Bacteroidales bacterium]
MNLKKIIVLISFVSVFFSCRNTSSEVLLTISPEFTYATQGETVSFVYVIIPDLLSDGELGEFYVRDSIGSEYFHEIYSGLNSVTDSFLYTVPDSAALGDTIKFVFTAVDGNSDYVTTSYAVIIVDEGYPEIVEASNITSEFISTSLTTKMMFDLTSSGVTMEDGQFIDGELAFIWYDTIGYSICSPNADLIALLFNENGITYSTEDKQVTKIMKYIGDWKDLTQTSINNLSIISDTLYNGDIGVLDLIEGDIIVFETTDGRKGALLVNTNSKAEKLMNSDLKFQIEAGK